MTEATYRGFHFKGEKMKEQIEALIKELISGVDDDMLEQYENGELEYWDSGNYDDAFEMGMSVGDDFKALDIASRLKEILDNN